MTQPDTQQHRKTAAIRGVGAATRLSDGGVVIPVVTCAGIEALIFSKDFLVTFMNEAAVGLSLPIPHPPRHSPPGNTVNVYPILPS